MCRYETVPAIRASLPHLLRATGQRGNAHNVITVRLGYLLNRSCPAQRVALGGSDLAELNQRPGPMTFSHRSCSTYVNSPDGPLSDLPARNQLRRADRSGDGGLPPEVAVPGHRVSGRPGRSGLLRPPQKPHKPATRVPSPHRNPHDLPRRTRSPDTCPNWAAEPQPKSLQKNNP